ncbi:MAG: hypothetical protein JSW27_16045 [Phycisphaerales bacterium]|nr:MAG: hypothetical protein JSW27_16045 [Phycisphaerales bacterium]
MKVRNKYVLSVVVVWSPCLLLAMGFHLLVLGPKMRRVNALEAELADARVIHGRAMEAAKEENRVALREAVAEVDSRVSDFVLRLEAAHDLAFEIGRLANRTAVESFAMKPRGRQKLEAVAGCDLLGEERIDVGFRSRFHDFAALLNAVERHRPILFVETFAIDRPRMQSSKPRASMELAVLVEKPRGD